MAQYFRLHLLKSENKRLMVMISAACLLSCIPFKFDTIHVQYMYRFIILLGYIYIRFRCVGFKVQRRLVANSDILQARLIFNFDHLMLATNFIELSLVV